VNEEIEDEEMNTTLKTTFEDFGDDREGSQKIETPGSTDGYEIHVSFFYKRCISKTCHLQFLNSIF
jgi:hypothetical protein